MATAKDKQDRDFRLKENFSQQPSLDFNKIKVGKTILKNDVFLNTDFFNTTASARRKISKEEIQRALDAQDVKTLRTISNYFFYTSGIYSRLCRYMAYLFRYDWTIVPYIFDNTIKEDKILEGWYKSCLLLENCDLKKNFGKIALKVIRNGCYYGYRIQQKSAAYLQELPTNYCRSRYELNGKKVVEFNVKYFDDQFSDTEYRIRILKMFPKEFQKAYIEYKKGKLQKDFNGDDSGWFVLDAASAIKFNLSETDIPLFIAIIPKLLDLEKAQGIDQDKMAQQLFRLIIQQLPIDKNGDLIFDVDEAQQLHNNAVSMIGDAIGVDVLTTFADVDVADLSDKGNVSTVDQLDKVERTVYNEAGVSQMQFNTNSNLALEKSILNDEATMTDLLLQFEDFAESLLQPFNKNEKRLKYKVTILPTTIYNYKEIAQLYKEQTMIGYSKLLPQVALGINPITVVSNAIFENELLHLNDLFIPPQMSSTMSGNTNSEDNGRPPLEDDEKSERSISRTK